MRTYIVHFEFLLSLTNDLCTHRLRPKFVQRRVSAAREINLFARTVLAKFEIYNESIGSQCDLVMNMSATGIGM